MAEEPAVGTDWQDRQRARRVVRSEPNLLKALRTLQRVGDDEGRAAMTTFVVLCRADKVSRKNGPYVLATRRVFRTWVDAEGYAAGIADARKPLVVEGRWQELRFPEQEG